MGNAALTLLYWHIGKRIHDEVLQGERSGYGDQIVSALVEGCVGGVGCQISFLIGFLNRLEALR